MHQRLTLAAAVLFVVLAGGCASTRPATPDARPIPVIYCTDLFHPHDDPDDHFDLACIYALPDIDVRAIILDQGAKQNERPGAIPVAQMNAITGRNIPAVTGLATSLNDPTDKAEDQAAEHQAGVTRIISLLESSDSPVTIVTVGSVRDLMAGWNRRPDLLRRKVRAVYAFIGEATNPDFQEYNVNLDVHAYVALLRSGLPVYWVPCFDGGLWTNHGHASYWKAPHRELLPGVADPVMNYFIYALTRQTSDPIEFLSGPIDPQLEAQVLASDRNLWCTAAFVALADKRIVRHDNAYAIVARDEMGDRTLIFDFLPARITVSDKGIVTDVSEGGRLLHRFQVLDREHYPEAMTTITAQLLQNLAQPWKGENN